MFTNPPASGNLEITGDASASISTGSLMTATSHIFSMVTMSADGSAINLTATFSDDTPCTLNEPNAGTAPDACSVCGAGTEAPMF